MNAAAFGYIAQLLLASAHLRPTPLSYLKTIAEPALKHGQAKVYFNARGKPSSFVVWALLSDRSVAQFLATGTWDLHESEWNEGCNPWLIDLIAPYDSCAATARRVGRELVACYGGFSYARLKAGNLHVCTIAPGT